MSGNWWNPVDGLKMTDSHARNLLLRKVQPANDLEIRFCDLNDLTIIPQTGGTRERIVPPGQRLSLHRPNDSGLVYGEE